ncbi:MAG: molybdopterin synthase sulfur carrier subunit [Elusimicrobia bacterium RIFCSPLOWO2_12_FULL_59_9]|nr:MAG: molybdopterin synthase sulfur carrier subunit [Elusimicrobia bacterium RIFCSPLOWO2_12_FULL_59_9]
MRVIIPSALRSYTGGQSEIEASAATIDELLRELDRRYPGFRFRIVDEQDSIRPHVKITINTEIAGSLDAPLRSDDDVAIIMAFSGG